MLSQTLPSTDRYTSLLNQALASVPKDSKCHAMLLRMAQRRARGQGFTEAETSYLEAAAKDPNTECDAPNPIVGAIIGIACLAVPFSLSIYFNAGRTKR